MSFAIDRTDRHADDDRRACDSCGAHAFGPGPCQVCGDADVRRLVDPPAHALAVLLALDPAGAPEGDA